ncbi:hypothetical protein [Rickettsia endosymbiont of Orchestes rusci]
MSKNSSTPLLLIRALLHGSEVVAKRLSFLAQGGNPGSHISKLNSRFII